MKTGFERSHPETAVLLIPEARHHQHWRHVRSAVIAILAALVIAALVVAFTVFFQPSSGVDGDGASRIAAASATAASACRTFWTKAPSFTSPLGHNPGDLPPYIVGDVGEQNAALLFVGTGSFYECFVKSPTSVVGMDGSPDGGSSRTPSAAHPVTLSSPALYTEVKAKFQLITGQAVRGVTSITLTLSDGTVVHPALGHGYFIAWWPGTAAVVSSTFVAHGFVHHLGGAPSNPFQQLGTDLSGTSP